MTTQSYSSKPFPYPIWKPGLSLKQIEKQAILEALSHYRWNMRLAAKALGISLTKIENRIKDYRIEGEIIPRFKQGDRKYVY